MTDDDIKKIAQVVDENIENRLGAMEQRLISQIRSELDTTEKRITQNVGEFVGDQLLPQIDELDERVTKIERLPAIALQIKPKKST